MDLLSWMKLFTTVIPSIIALLSLLYENKDKTTGRLKTSGRVCLFAVLASMVLGSSILVIEQRHNTDYNQKDNILKSRIFSTTSNIEENSDRILYKIEDPTIQAQFIVDCTDKVFEDFCQSYSASNYGPGVYFDHRKWPMSEHRDFPCFQFTMTFTLADASGRENGVNVDLFYVGSTCAESRHFDELENVIYPSFGFVKNKEDVLIIAIFRVQILYNNGRVFSLYNLKKAKVELHPLQKELINLKLDDLSIKTTNGISYKYKMEGVNYKRQRDSVDIEIPPEMN